MPGKPVVVPVDRRGDKWHVGKEIPLVLIGAFILQICAIVWSYTTLTNKVDALVESYRELRIERYSKEDARRDRDYILQLTASQNQRDLEQDRRITSIEQAIGDLRRNVK